MTRLETLVAAEARRPAMAAAHVLAEAARAKHGASVAAVLFYGSCLREAADEGRILDLYLLVDSYRAAGEGPVLAFLARLLPPNVHYLEIPFDGQRIRAKYALLSTAELADRVTDRGESYFWGRFAQPVRILWARDQTTEAHLIEALAQATRTFLDETMGLLPAAPAADLWPMGLGLSYRTELRPEKPHKSAELYRASAAHYESVLDTYRAEGRPLADHGTLRRRWRRRRRRGKWRSVLRLCKAAFTFDGGADYLLWKIERHSGVRLQATPWQRRHPLLAAPALFVRLYRAGAFR